MSTHTKPRWNVNGERRRGEAAHALAVEDRATIEARLSPGRIDGLRADVDGLVMADAGATSDLARQRAATAAERDAASAAHDLVMTVREAAKRRAPDDHELGRALGVGDRVRPGQTAEVAAGLDAIVRLGGDTGTGLAAIGVTPDDVTEAIALATALRGRDADQAGRFTARASSTAARIATRLAVEAAIDEIAAAGGLAFRGDATRRARYEALVAHVASEAADAPPAPPAPPAAHA